MPPERVVDVRVSVGDTVDNVPGVPGIGEKGARDLVKEFGALEDVLANAEKIKRNAYREGLLNNKDAAILSKSLVTLRADVPVTLDLDALKRRPPNRSAANALFTELEFVALAKEYAPEAGPSRTEYAVLTEPDAVSAAVDEARKAKKVAVCFVRDAREPMRARPLGVALAWKRGHAVYIPLHHSPLEVPDGRPTAELMELMRPLFEDPLVLKLSARGKHDRIMLCEQGLGCESLGFDALIASYLLNPGRRQYTLEDLAVEFLGERPQPSSPLIEGGGEVSLSAAAAAATQDADIALRLEEPLTKRLDEEGLAGIYAQMELPLVEVLADMERAGVKVNVPFLADMSRDMEQQIADLTVRIHELAGGPFNINSPSSSATSCSTGSA